MKRGEKLPPKIRGEYISQVYELLLVGCHRRDIMRFAVKNDWVASPRCIEDLIAIGKRELERDIKNQQLDSLEKFVRSAWNLHSRAYARKEFALCNEIRKDLQKLQDKYPTEKHDVNLQSDTLAEWLKKSSNGSNPIPKKGNRE